MAPSERIYSLRREATEFYRAVHPLLAPLDAMMLQSNLAVISLQQNEISVRQNETSRQLTVIATVFLPLTFITGFFGMNFNWLTNHDMSLTVFLIWGVGSLIVSLVALAFLFKRRGWFESADEPS